MENVLEIKNVTKEYKNFKLDNINFNLPKGFIMGFIGQNGAGKTTTIKLIMNLIAKDNGEIVVFGKDNIKYEKEIKENIGFVYDDCFYYEHLSIKDNAKIISNFYKQWSFPVFNSYLNKFSLNENQKVKELSKGMKMKYAIAIALSHNAKLLILDEPTSGLDPVVRREVLDILQDIIQEEEIGILISTHITSDLEKIADYITYIDDGRIVFSKGKDEVVEEYKVIKGDKTLLNSESRKLLIGVRETSCGFEGLTNRLTEVKKVFKGNLVIETPKLEDIMLFYSRQGDIK